MSIVESLQGLSLDTKSLIVIMALLWCLSELRHAIRHRADRRTIQRLQADDNRTARAVLEAHRLPDVPHGAALTLGEVVPRGAKAGQYFVGTINNAGAVAAENIQVSASLGTIKAGVVAAPRRLLPHSAAAAIEMRLPFGFLTSAEVVSALQAGEPLRVRIAFTDGTPAPRDFEQCFAFQLEPIGPEATGSSWVSRRVQCP